MIAMTANLFQVNYLVNGIVTERSKTIQSLHRNEKVQGEMTPNILTQIYKLDLRISPYYVIVSYLDFIRL